MTERQIDVTEFVQNQTDGWASFLIVQDHRWDVAIPSGTYIGSNVLHSANTTSRGVATDANAALTHTGTKTASRSFALNKNNTNPQDLVTDGTTVWVTQVDDRDKVFVYRASNGLLPGSWNIDSANGSPVGITIDPTMTTGSLWIVDNVTKRVYEYANGRARTTGSQIAAKIFDLNAGNASPQGIADPPTGAPTANTTATINQFAAGYTAEEEKMRIDAPISGSSDHDTAVEAIDRVFVTWGEGLSETAGLIPTATPVADHRASSRVTKRISKSWRGFVLNEDNAVGCDFEEPV